MKRVLSRAEMSLNGFDDKPEVEAPSYFDRPIYARLHD